MKMLIAVVVTIAIFVSTSCSPRTPSTSEMNIYGGQIATGQDWESAVAITFETLSGNNRVDSIFCTGTLVHPRVVITAAHCLDLLDVDPSSVEFLETVKIYVGNGSEGGYVTSQHRIVKAAKNPLYTPDNTFPVGRIGGVFDSAYLLLENEVGVEKVARIFSVPDDFETSLREGAQVTIVGFGKRESGQRGLKYRATTEIKNIESDEVVLGGDGVDACKNDSGGPAYILGHDNIWKVFGIVSRGISEETECGAGGVWGLIHKSIDWVIADSGIAINDEQMGKTNSLPPEVELDLARVIDKFQAAYPEIEFVLDAGAEDPVPYPDMEGPIRKVIVPRSYPELFGRSERDLVTTICHELGHHFGGEPTYSEPYQWSSCEGQADYWLGDLHCWRRYWGDSYSIENGLTDALSYLSKLASVIGEPAPSRKVQDNAAVADIQCIHPSVQCRFDTIKNAIYGDGRPNCWYPVSP